MNSNLPPILLEPFRQCSTLMTRHIQRTLCEPRLFGCAARERAYQTAEKKRSDDHHPHA